MTFMRVGIIKIFFLQIKYFYFLEKQVVHKGVATDLKVGGSIFWKRSEQIFLGPPHILQGPPHFLGGSFQMWGGPEKFLYTVV